MDSTFCKSTNTSNAVVGLSSSTLLVRTFPGHSCGDCAMRLVNLVCRLAKPVIGQQSTNTVRKRFGNVTVAHALRYYTGTLE